MTNRFASFLCVVALMSTTACSTILSPVSEAYWQRVEAASALRMKGPKAQQQLDEDIAGCVREIDELTMLGALRETLPPDTHAEYHKALDASGDLAYLDTPTRHKEKMVDHSDYHDFESCMRHAGWERVRYVRYQTAAGARNTYKATQELRTYGVTGKEAEAIMQARKDALTDDYKNLNN